ncbi:MAG TPA: Hsp20/alpha crystallin family protein [Polyangiaceae bacterium]|nr:Hsp20/alpha crystallin family protein [Polyangiaceae bacterium]
MLNTWNAVATLDRMFDDVMGAAFGTATNSRTFDPAVDVRTSDTEVHLAWDMPGMKQEDLEITLADHVLTVKGTRRFEGKDNERVMLGRAYGSFTRSYTLPESLDEQRLTAELADGVLTVRIPRLPEAQPRKIQIGQGSTPKQLNQ